MKLIKIDETLIEIPDHNYTELVSLHKKAFGSYDSYIDLRKLANIRQEYFDYIDKLLTLKSNPNRIRPTMTLLEKICLSTILLFSTIFLVFILYLIFH